MLTDYVGLGSNWGQTFFGIFLTFWSFIKNSFSWSLQHKLTLLYSIYFIQLSSFSLTLQYTFLSGITNCPRSLILYCAVGKLIRSIRSLIHFINASWANMTFSRLWSISTKASLFQNFIRTLSLKTTLYCFDKIFFIYTITKHVSQHLAKFSCIKA